MQSSTLSPNVKTTVRSNMVIKTNPADRISLQNLGDSVLSAQKQHTVVSPISQHKFASNARDLLTAVPK